VDTGVILVVILIFALVWRGSRTLPQLGAMLGRGVKQARRQIDPSKSGRGDGERPA